MKLYFAITCILLTLFSCKKDSDVSTIDYAYLGGEIINPNTNYIVLSKNQTVIDTVNLDGRNRFLYKIEDLDEGLYTFRHGGEFQLILLEPKDSLLFRLNTLDFDESLVYSGIGDKKNNYFINEFLENEQEEKYIVKLCQSDGNKFSKRVDSLKESKFQALNKFSKRFKPSPLFMKIAKANIEYSYYSSKEVYPFVHFGKNKAAILNSLPKDFYDYRKDVNYNDEFLSSHHIYNKFLRYNLNNLTLKQHDLHDENACFDRKSLCFNLDRLKLIDSLVTIPGVKDELLYYFTRKYLSKSKNEEHNNLLLKSYLQKSKNEKSKKLLADYTNSVNSLKENVKLPKIKVLNYSNKQFDINTLIDSPTVITFWSHKHYEHFKKSHYKLKELKTKYPAVKFITINIDDYSLIKSEELLKKHKFYNVNEVKLKNPKEALEILAVFPMTKTILIDKQKKVINNNTNIFSSQFEEQVLGVINR